MHRSLFPIDTDLFVFPHDPVPHNASFLMIFELFCAL